MKKLTLLIALLLIGLSANALAGNPTSSVSANATATIVQPILISHSGTDLQFGNIIANAAGTVTIDPAGAASYSTGVAAPSTPGTRTAASFTVTGANMLYVITLPADNAVSLTGPGTPMTLSTFTSSPSGTGTISSGTSTLTVGATLNVGASQVAGAYSGTFSVTVAYN